MVKTWPSVESVGCIWEFKEKGVGWAGPSLMFPFTSGGQWEPSQFLKRRTTQSTL